MSPPAEIIVEGKTVTLPNPQKFDSTLRSAGALGFCELSEKGNPSARVCNDLGMLTSGSEYIYWRNHGNVSHGTPPINPRAPATLNVLSYHGHRPQRRSRPSWR